LYQSFEDLRKTPVTDFIEPAEIASSNDSISQLIGLLDKRDSYDIFLPLPGKVAALNIRDILGVRNINSTNPTTLGHIIPTLHQQSKTSEAATIMNLYRLRALPILDKDKIVGQISAKKIVNSIKDKMIAGKIPKINASSLMTPSPITVAKTDKVSHAITIIKTRQIDHLPVVQDDRLVGMITSKDILKLRLKSERVGRNSFGIDETTDRFDLLISGLENKNIVSSDIQDTLQSVIDLMISQNSTYCILKTAEEVQGIITFRDIIALLGEKIEEDLPIFMIGLPDDPMDAELVKSKLRNIVKLLKNTYPDIEEVRCRMKIRAVKGARKRYEVDSTFVSTHGVTSYSNNGWDLAKMFDEMSDSIKKKLAHKITTKDKQFKYRTRTTS
jgi:CBS domain-containing protein